jgi:MerR family transcriptional regulator, light-induced transcriptional regulator
MDRRENDSSHGTRIGELCRAFASALLAADEVRAELVIRDAIDANLSTAEVDDQIIAPSLWYVGELWERGEISVADEHIATEICVRVLALQREARRLARDRGDHRVMLAAPAGEHHVVALQMTGNLLREAGYEVTMLGADVPARALALAAGRLGVDVICMSATMPGGADHTLFTIDAVREERPSTGFVVGGRALGSRVRSRPGVEVCGRVSEAVEAVDATVKRAGMN